MAQRCYIFLVPGFIGFESLGELIYFAHVREYLEELCSRQNVHAVIHRVEMSPTASLARRTARLLETVAQVAGEDDNPIHLVGHSSGGLDARLLTTPGVALPTDVQAEPYARRVRTVITVSTPHHGTPLATFFSSMMGLQLLRMLSLATTYVLRFGRLPMSALFKLGALFARVTHGLGMRGNVADQLYSQLLGDFSPERRDAVRQVFTEMGTDQALVAQLMPQSTDAFNAATGDRRGVRYACVLSAVQRDIFRQGLRLGLDPYGQATHALFVALSRVTAGMSTGYLPTLQQEQLTALRRTVGEMPGAASNDGVVPLLSQIWGEIIHVADADHLDAIGHFDGPEHRPPHYDWLASGSRFDRPAFEALWSDVMRYVRQEPTVGYRDPSIPVPQRRGLFGLTRG